MRDGWERPHATFAPAPAAVQAMVAAALPGARVVTSTLLSGGLANTSLAVDLDRAPGRVVLRLYQKGAAAAAKECAVARRVAGDVPVAAVRYLDEEAVPPFAVLDWVEGRALGRVAGSLDDRALAAIGREAGRALATVHARRYSEAGLLDATLAVAAPFPGGGSGLAGFLESCLGAGPVRARLGDGLAQGVLALARAAAPALDAWPGAACLVHGDANGSNLLVHDGGSGWRLAALLDWEFAASASPHLDLGNLVRPPLGACPGFGEALAAGYREVDPGLPADWRRLAGIIDLAAWLEFLSRPDAGPALVADARRTIAATVARG